MLSGNIACLHDSRRNRVVPGRMKKTSRGSKKKRRTFVSLGSLLADNLKALKRRRHLKTSKVLEIRARNRTRVANETAQCEMTTPPGGPLPDPRGGSPAFGSNLSFGESAPWSGGPGLRIRWFPDDQAQGYYLYVYRSNGVVFSKSPIGAGGCTLRSMSGYTSGLCSIVLNRAAYPAGFSLAVSSFNAAGESMPIKF